jgi:hypothetical protein
MSESLQRPVRFKGIEGPFAAFIDKVNLVVATCRRNDEESAALQHQQTTRNH